jgi:uncharacterized protein (TIGR03083 family)
MGPTGEAYAACRERIGGLVRELDDREAGVRVPACPEWSVHDVLAHVAGVVDDALAGRLDGVATDPWTAAQVEARRDKPVAVIVKEWDAAAAAFEPLLDPIGDPGRQAVADLVTHEHDIRGALRAPGARDSDAVDVGLSFLAPTLVQSAASHGVALQVRDSRTGALLAGAEDASVTLRSEPFELLRAMTGRRSVEQLRSLSWSGDVDAVIPAFTFGPFTPAASPIDE